jgi:hypothetical protein
MNNRFDIEFVKYEFAKYSFRECLNFLDLHKELHTYVQDNLSFGNMVSTAFVVTYARPFSKSNKEYHGMSMGAISTKWLKKLSQSLTEKHNYLVGTGRNALAAHIDLGKLMPNVFVKDGPHNDYVFDLHLPIINDNSLCEYEELTKAALQFCQVKQDGLKPHLSSNHLIPEVHHPDASCFVKRSSKKSDG